MNELFTNIISIIEKLLIHPLIWLFPIKWITIIPGSSAVRFTFGLPGPDLKPGIHFGTIGQTFHKEHVRTRLASAESMYVLTEDGVSLRVSGVTIYKITSLVKYLTITEDSNTFVLEACEAAIKNAISSVPFDDLVVDSNTVEEAISVKISKICKELGIKVKRYRFQDIELTDPIGRGLSSLRAMEPTLTSSAKNMTNSSPISFRDAVAALSPNIHFISNILSVEQPKSNLDQEEKNESEGISE